MSEIDSTVADLMQAADAYAKDHYIEGRWAGSREELERNLVDALTAAKEPEWRGIVRSVVYGLGVASIAGLPLALWSEHSTRQTLLTVIEQRDKLAEQRGGIATTSSDFDFYKRCACDACKGIWIDMNGQCFEVR